MQLVLVTYTYNDAQLLNGLLTEMLSWSVRPRHIFVIDDASSLPYKLPDELASKFGASAALSVQTNTTNKTSKPNAPGIDVVRPGPHLGPAQAKAFGINLAFDAGADVVLSIDCDVRLHKDWLRESIEILTKPEVGLVGADLAHGLAGDTLSRYLRAFEQPPTQTTEVSFLGAGVWLLRKDVWHSSGGLGEHEQLTHEDLYFCRRLHDLGLRLVALNALPATQVRRLARSSYFGRELRYIGFAVLHILETQGAKNALEPLRERAKNHIAQANLLSEPGFVYIELLWAASLLLWLSEKLNAQPSCADDLHQPLNQIAKLFASYPNTLELLSKDLIAMHLTDEENTPWLNCDKHIECEENISTSVSGLVSWMFEPWLEQPELLSALNQTAAAQIMVEDGQFSFDRHYLEQLVN